ncbi:MAG: amidohydrolase family protein [Cyclobacteriaceae bacterium]
MAVRKRYWIGFPLAVLAFLLVAWWLVGRIQYRLNVMDVEDYEPRSTLKVSTHELRRAKYPFVDVHNHQWAMPVQDLSKLVREMDSLNMAVMVDLSGFRGKYLEWSQDNITDHYPTRFVLFLNIDFELLDDPGWPDNAIKLLEDGKAQGVRGLKVYKSLGLTDKDNSGKRIAIDDSRLDPIWAKCGQLGLPVLIHSGEPSSFWDPRDKFNERWLELKQEPGRYRSPDKYPTFEEILGEQHRVFRKHPETIFIDAHLGWLGGDLERLGRLLDDLPNVYTELGAVLAELGRQPRNARQWMIRYQDRVLMGKDTYKLEEYYTYFRVLETADEYFDYYRKRHAHWKMYGLDLPDTVLRKVYYRNALRIIPGLDPTLFPK